MGKVKDSQNLSAEMSSMDDCITHLREQEAKLKEEVKFLKGKEKERLCLQMWLDDLKQQGYCSFEKKTSLGSAWEKSMTIHFVHDTKGKQIPFNDIPKLLDEKDNKIEELKKEITHKNDKFGEWMEENKKLKKENEELEEEIDEIYKGLRKAEGIKEFMTDREGIAEAVYDYVQGFHEKENKIEELEKTIEDNNATIHTWKMSCKLKDNENEELRDTIKKLSKHAIHPSWLNEEELKKLLKEAEGDFDYSEDDDWDCAYGSGWEINDDGYPEWTIVMAGGGDHWWNYVLRPNGIYKCDKNGYDKLEGRLISCPEGTYVYHEEAFWSCRREDEYDIAECIDWEEAPNPSTC